MDAAIQRLSGQTEHLRGCKGNGALPFVFDTLTTEELFEAGC